MLLPQGLTRAFLCTAFREPDDGSGSNREIFSSTPLPTYFRGAPRFDATGAILTRLFGGFEADFLHYISGKEF
jgi:hypothetical protein